MKSQAGLTLMEVLIAISVLALIAAISAGGIKNMDIDAQSAVVQNNAMNILDGVNAFYEEECSGGTNPQPTISTLVSRGFIEPADTRNPIGGPFSVRIFWGNPTRLQVSTRLTDVPLVGRSMMSDNNVGSTYYWEQIPRILTDPAATFMMEERNIHNPGECQ